jgi:hypothetical protein
VSENTKLWDLLGRTDPKHTQPFTRGGGFKGTAIKPMFSYRRMTEEFGPCGKGWGVGEPSFQIVPGPEGEMLVFCTASIWYRHEEAECRVYGVGGDKAVGKNKYGLQTDDEAFKKAFTDAVTNALKLIGVGADVHMGLFDDNKYVNTMREEFADGPATAPANTQTKSSSQLKKDGAWEKIKAELDSDLVDCHSIVALNTLKEAYRAKVRENGWPSAWQFALSNEFGLAEEAIKKTEILLAGE